MLGDAIASKKEVFESKTLNCISHQGLVEGGQPNLRLFNQLYWTILSSFLLVLHAIFPLPNLIRHIPPIALFLTTKRLLTKGTCDPWLIFVAKKKCNTCNDSVTLRWKIIWEISQNSCVYYCWGWTVQLFRGTFPADSKRGRICLLHDMGGDSDFEVNLKILREKNVEVWL